MTAPLAREAEGGTVTESLTVQAREQIGQALYEHWVAEDFGNEYCSWEQLPDKETWLARADAVLVAAAHMASRITAAIRKLKEEG